MELLKIDYYPYRLLPRSSNYCRNERYGVLLRLSDHWGNSGYSDCHPWKEFGDGSIVEQLLSISNGNPLPLSFNSLCMAYADLQSALEENSLFQHCTDPIYNHWLCRSLADIQPHKLQQLSRNGFHTVKLKIDCSWIYQKSKLLAAFKQSEGIMRWRFDPNSSFNGQQAVEFFTFLKPFAHLIDWVEDPTSFQKSLWQELKELSGIEVANDWELSTWQSNNSAISTQVIKPAREGYLLDQLPYDPCCQYIFSSYLDHPVGQQIAHWLAHCWYRRYRVHPVCCGLASHFSYRPTAFHKELGLFSPLPIPNQSGWGWRELLSSLVWRRLHKLASSPYRAWWSRFKSWI